MKQIRCNVCGVLFRADKIRIQKRTIDEDRGLDQSYFKCPSCRTEYTILITDPETRDLIRAGKRDEAKERSLMLRVKYLDYSLRR